MMRHPAVHIALIVLIALVLTLIARGCDGDHDHESELPAEQGVMEAPLPAPVAPAEPMAPAPSPARQETKAPGKPNPCLKRTPAPGVSSSPPAPASGPPAPAGAEPGQSLPSPAAADTPEGPGRDMSVLPYAKGSRPCVKGPPAGRSTPAATRPPASEMDEPPPPAPKGSVGVLPTAQGGNPCVKGPPVRTTAPTPASSPADATNEGGTPAPVEDMSRAAGQGGSGSTGGGPRLVTSLDDGPPVTRRIMRRGGEAAAPRPSSRARLAASMDDGAPAPGGATTVPEDRHEHQHQEGIEHEHDTPAVAGGGDSVPGDHARHVERMKAGGHDDLSHVRVDPPAYPAPEKYHSGRDLYQAHCRSCHGDQGTGSDHAPPLLHPYYNPNDHGDDYFYNAVANGARQHLWEFGDMPPLPHVNRQQVGEIISYVRWLQRQANIY